MLAAVDVDLRRIHCRTEDGEDVCTNVPFDEAIIRMMGSLDPNDTTLLVECASPHIYGQAFKKKISWIIYNSVITSRIDEYFPKVLVAPSSTWTYGYDVKKRHVIASCTAKNKDLRECEAMMYFYHKNPSKWMPLEDYLASL